MTTELTTIRDTPGLTGYLAEIELRLAASVETHPGLVADIGKEALAAGGKRLRPLLCYLASSPDDEPPVAAGVAVELIHAATLVHDDVVDESPTRRGQPAGEDHTPAQLPRVVPPPALGSAGAPRAAAGPRPLRSGDWVLLPNELG